MTNVRSVDGPGGQRSLDDCGVPLSQVTFVVIDLETTGGSPGVDAITEIGAVKLRGGVRLGTFQTLVNPGVPIPPQITWLTGITEAMSAPAPAIAAVLPAFFEYVGPVADDVVIVGHNVRFDLGFLRAAAEEHGYPRLGFRFVDTCSLARRLVRDEVRDCKLATLAEHFRLAVRPTHRALDDAQATGELLHRLLERAGSLGVLGLDDLLELPTSVGHPQAGKLKWVAKLPRKPGVYLFKDPAGRVLYVGKAVDLRRRVRQYFGQDDRRKISQLLREAASLDHIVCANELEASVLEVRLIHQLTPRFNRQSKRWRSYAYLKVTLDERFPRLSVVASPRPADGCLYVGPLPSRRAAGLLVDAVHTATRVRRCNSKIPARGPTLAAPCAPAQLGVAVCPCAGTIDASEYDKLIDEVVRGLTVEPSRLLESLNRKMRALSDGRRYEEAATVRDRAAALSSALARQRRLQALRDAGRLCVEIQGEGGAVVDGGKLVATWTGPDPPLLAAERIMDDAGVRIPAMPTPIPTELADELSAVAAWLDARAERIRVSWCDAGLSSPLPRLARFEPGRTRVHRTD